MVVVCCVAGKGLAFFSAPPQRIRRSLPLFCPCAILPAPTPTATDTQAGHQEDDCVPSLVWSRDRALCFGSAMLIIITPPSPPPLFISQSQPWPPRRPSRRPRTMLRRCWTCWRRTTSLRYVDGDGGVGGGVRRRRTGDPHALVVVRNRQACF